MGFDGWNELGLGAGLGIPGAPEKWLYKQFKKGNGYSVPPQGTVNPLMAGDVSLADPLKAPLGTINQSGQDSLASVLGRAGTRARTSSIASGRIPGQYQGQALERANMMASRGIEDSLAGVLGEASLKDTQNEREFQANMAMANVIGSLNKPSQIEEIMGALGQGADSALEFKGLYDALGKRGSKGRYRDSGPDPDYYDYRGGGSDYGYF